MQDSVTETEKGNLDQALEILKDIQKHKVEEAEKQKEAIDEKIKKRDSGPSGLLLVLGGVVVAVASVAAFVLIRHK